MNDYEHHEDEPLDSDLITDSEQDNSHNIEFDSSDDDLEDKESPKFSGESEDLIEEEGTGLQRKIKHNYTSELELKALLICIKNDRLGLGSKSHNRRLRRYIRLHTELSNMKHENTQKKNRVKNAVRDLVVSIAENTSVDKLSYERFGEIILLMIKNILRKPQFSGYTWKDEFYSDAVHKILKYLHNFDHTKISKRTGLPVNAFAYISQYIHHSVIFVINKKKKESENMEKLGEFQIMEHEAHLGNHDSFIDSDYSSHGVTSTRVHLSTITTTLYDEILILMDSYRAVDRIDVYFPNDYVISFEEYNKIRPFIKKVSIIRSE